MRPVRSSTASTKPSRCSAILQVGREAERLATGGLDQIDRLADGARQRGGRTGPHRMDGEGVGSRGHHYGGALCGQPLGDRPADSPATAGDQSRFTGE